MIYCNTVRYEGKNGIWRVTRKEDGFVDVTILTANGEHHLEFSSSIFKTLTAAFNGIEAGKDCEGPDAGECLSVKPDVSLHIEDQKIDVGFEENDDYNPAKDQWPAIVLRNKNLRLGLNINLDQAKILMERCRQIVNLGAAVEDCASGMLEEKAA